MFVDFVVVTECEDGESLSSMGSTLLGPWLQSRWQLDLDGMNALIGNLDECSSNGEWKALPDAENMWKYHESESERALANDMDRKFLKKLTEKDPDRFLKEMTPNPEHDGLCAGLDLNHPHHRDLQKAFQKDVTRICQEKGLAEHPALIIPPIDDDIQQALIKKQNLERKFKDLENQHTGMINKIKELMDSTTQTMEHTLKFKSLTKNILDQCVQTKDNLLKATNNHLEMEKKNVILRTEIALLKAKMALATTVEITTKSRSSWLRIWHGKKTPEEETPSYEAVGTKEQGYAIGFIAKSQKGHRYLAKLGMPDEEQQIVKSMTTRSKTYQRSVLSVIMEKLAADVYGALGYGFFYVPKHRLAMLEIVNDFTKANELTIAVMQRLNKERKEDQQITKGLHLLSRWIEPYQDLSTLKDCYLSKTDTEPKSFMECIKSGRLPNCARLDGHMIPITGLMEVLAISRLLADTDVLGGGAQNTGYVIEQENGKPVAIRIVKVDAGEAFNFSGETNQLTQFFNPLSGGEKLKDPKDLQFGNQQTTVIEWAKLSAPQQQSFLATLKRGLDFLGKEAVIDFLIHRNGAFATVLKDVLNDDMVTMFKQSWQKYRNAQAMTQVYGDVLASNKPLVPPTVPFHAKVYGAVTHSIEEAEQLATTPSQSS